MACRAPLSGELPRLLASLVIASSLAGVLSGCAELRSDWARAKAARIAESGRLTGLQVEAGQFTLAAYQRIAVGGDDTLVVYIEGDGRAWINRGQLSEDPTPTDPIALRLAAQDDAPTILYLARPCQFVTGAAARNCEPRFWSMARFAVEVVEAADRAVNIVKTTAGKSKIELIGYSGGGVLATLLAVRRDDVSRVITVAANLDLSFWTTYHHVAPLSESLNPVDFVAQLSRIHQVIFVGGRDEVVPPATIDHYLAKLPARAPVSVISIAGFSHTCCWTEVWSRLVRKARALP